MLTCIHRLCDIKYIVPTFSISLWSVHLGKERPSVWPSERGGSWNIMLNYFIILNYLFHIVGGTESVSSKFWINSVNMMTSFFYLSRQYILFLGYVIAATGTLPYKNKNNRDVPIEVFDLTNNALTCKNLTNITTRLGSTGGFVQNKILICGGWSYRTLP